MNEVKYMRLFVMFDLPTDTKENRKEYAQFRRFLIQDGYDMLQYSIYVCLVRGEDAVDKHLRKLYQNKPSGGAIRALQITERQYEGMKIICGGKTRQEQTLTSQMTLEF